MKEKKDLADDDYMLRGRPFTRNRCWWRCRFIRAIKAISNLDLDNEDQNTGVAIIKAAVGPSENNIEANAGGEASVVVNAVAL